MAEVIVTQRLIDLPGRRFGLMVERFANDSDLYIRRSDDEECISIPISAIDDLWLTLLAFRSEMEPNGQVSH